MIGLDTRKPCVHKLCYDPEKKIEKIGLKIQASLLTYVKTIQNSADCIALDCFKTREIGVDFSIQHF